MNFLTHRQEQALYMAWEEYSRSKWEIIANNMPKYGCAEKWPKELVQKKLQGTSDLTTTHGKVSCIIDTLAAS